MDYEAKIHELLDEAKMAELEGDQDSAEACRAEAQWLSLQMDDYDFEELNTDLEVV